MQQANLLCKPYYSWVYSNEKKIEIECLNQSDIIFANNLKDEALLLREKIAPQKVRTLVPYYHKYDVNRAASGSAKDCMFFGDMGRPENYEAAIWFIREVFPLVKHKDVRFVVVGGRAEKLLPYQSDKVVVTGFVESPEDYFAYSAVFVAPLLRGAGIKIKVLEAMSSGIPVITNTIGIEGIPAEDGESYYLYHGKEDLAQLLDYVLDHPEESERIGQNGKRMLEGHFNYSVSVEEYVDAVLAL